MTLRRYMNYLIDKNSVIGGVDYSTGGRPSAVYTYIASKATSQNSRGSPTGVSFYTIL